MDKMVIEKIPSTVMKKSNLHNKYKFSREEEIYLFRQWRKYKDREAYEQLTLSMICLLKREIKLYKQKVNFKDYEYEDFFSLGTETIIRCIDKFRLSNKTRLSTLVVCAIRRDFNTYQFKFKTREKRKCPTKIESLCKTHFKPHCHDYSKNRDLIFISSLLAEDIKKYLPTRTQKMMYLFYFLDKSCYEITRELHISNKGNIVSSCISQGRQILLEKSSNVRYYKEFLEI